MPFHLIKKYSNRKMYDSYLKKFIKLEELIQFILNKEQLQIVDSDTNIDITPMETSKAIIRYINENNLDTTFMNELIRQVNRREVKSAPPPAKKENVRDAIDELIQPNDEILSYIPAEIRLLNKSLEYLQGAIEILKSELPFNAKMHEELYVLYREFERKLIALKKKYRIS